MTAEQAMDVVNHLTFTVQRMRAMGFEEIGEDEVSRRVLAYTSPWVYGDKCLLPALVQLQDRGSVAPMELYNLCYVAHHLSPIIAMSAGIIATAWEVGKDIPEPDSTWVTEGWR